VTAYAVRNRDINAAFPISVMIRQVEATRQNRRLRALPGQSTKQETLNAQVVFDVPKGMFSALLAPRINVLSFR